MDLVLDAGADDLTVEDGVAEIWGAPDAFTEIAKALEDAGIECSEANITRRPENVVEVKDVSTAQHILRLIDRLEELDDVQSVNSNEEIVPEVMEQIDAME